MRSSWGLATYVWRRVWYGLCLIYWFSPLPHWFSKRATLDSLTADLLRCRGEIEARRGSPRFRPEFETHLMQLEWEHVRRLQQAGRGRDPFVLAVEARLRS